MLLQYRICRFVSALVFASITSLTPLSVSAQSKSDAPEGQVWYNGDRAVPIWFADDAIAILNPDFKTRSAAELSQITAQLIPGAEVTQATDFGGILQLPPSQGAAELLASADTITRVPNRYAAVYRTGPDEDSEFIIQNGELVVFAMSGVSKEQIDSLVIKPHNASFLQPLIEGQAYLYSCASDQSCLQAANELYDSPLVKYAYPNWVQFRSVRGSKQIKPSDGADASVQPRFIITDPLYSDQYHLKNTGQNSGTIGEDVNVQGAYDLGYTGRANQITIINIVDDGVEISHEDLTGNVVETADVHLDLRDGDTDPSPVDGSDVHGTSVAGIAAADGFNGLGVSGAAPRALLVGVRLIGGGATDAQEAQAMLHNLTDIEFPDVSNNSWGPADNGDYHSAGPLILAAFENGVNNGRQLGGVSYGLNYVWAGGNGLQSDDNSNYDSYANSRYTIAVAASDNNGEQSTYSEPGANLLVNSTSAPTASPVGGTTTTDLSPAGAGYDPNSAYTDTFGGTSSASPLVAGVISLMLDASPNLYWRDVQKILATTAERNDPTDSDWVQNSAGHWVNHKYGFGRVDATAAVTAALNWTNLAAEVVASSTITPNAAIPQPENGGGALTLDIPLTDSVSMQHVYLTVDTNHTYAGDLEIILTSPSGTQSVLATTHNAAGAQLNGGFTFSSMRHLDEDSAGTWTVQIQDNLNADTGTVSSVKLEVFGTPIEATPGDGLYYSIASGGTINGSEYSAADILRFDTSTGLWSMFFDASDVGLTTVNGFHILDSNDLPEVLFTVGTIQTVAGIGQVRRQDVVKFTPSSLGDTTAGTFSLFLDGSDVGLTTTGEYLSAVMMSADGRLVISTEGNNVVPGIPYTNRDEDLLALNADGTWEVYLDGSDIGLTNSVEEIWGATLDASTGDLLLSTKGNYAVAGDSGKGGDVFRCASPQLGPVSSCASLSETFVGQENGLGTRIIDALAFSAASGGNGGGNGGGTVTAVAQDASAILDSAGSASITAGVIDGGSTAEDGLASLSVSPALFSCDDLGLPVDVTLTVTDVNGVSDTDQAQVNVLDLTAPFISGLSDITVALGGSGTVTIAPEQVLGGSTDNCGVTTATVTPSSFTSDNVGPNTVEVAVSDGSGNTTFGFVTVTVEPAPPVSTDALYMSMSSSGSVGGVSYTASDIIRFDPATGQWEMIFDASDVGLNGTNAFHMMGSGALPDMLFTMSTVQTVAGAGQVRRQDVLKFTPSSLGDTTAGTFSLFLDGSDFGLTTSGEYLSAVMMSADGRLVVSTEGNHVLPGLVETGRDEDLVALNPDGTWDVYLDGSDLLLTSSAEELWGATLDPATGDLLLSTKGNYSVPGDSSGRGGDVLRCTAPQLGVDSSCVSLNEYFVGQQNGLGTRIIDALSLGASGGGGATGTVTAIAQDIIVGLDESGAGTITAEQVNDGSTAEDGIALISVSPDTFSCDDLGEILPITLTVTDVNGVTDTAQASAEIADFINPTAVGQDITVTLDASGNATISAIDVDGGSTDNCFIDLSSDATFPSYPDPSDFTTADIGANTVSYGVSDVYGNQDFVNITVTVVEAPPVSTTALHMSMSSSGSVGGVSYTASDIIRFDPATEQWEMIFDASDVGLNGINAFHMMSSGALPEVLFTLSSVQTVAGVGQVRRQDVLKFTPSSLGDTTAGTFSLFLDGSDVGLTTSGEYLSAVMMSADGRLVVSTEGNHVLPGLAETGRDEDLVALNPDGTWDVYLDGSDLLLTSSAEELWGATLDPATGDLLLSTKGNYSVPGDSSGRGGDVLRCTAPQLGVNSSCASLGEYFVGQQNGLGTRIIDALSLAAAAPGSP